MKQRAEYTRSLYVAGAYSYSFAIYALSALGMDEQAAHAFLISA